MEKTVSKNWLKSNEARKIFKISDCDLMHLRVMGKVKFKKDGNRFYYSFDSLNQYKTTTK